MKKIVILLLAVCLLKTAFSQKTQNVILVTLDGYRWQELFGGPQKKLLNNRKFTKDKEALVKAFVGESKVESRKKLTPFFWEEIASKGQLIGNKKIGSKMSLTNGHKFSYPGYSEIFCGWGDHKINSNDYPDNPHENIFDFLEKQEDFKYKTAAVGTWDAFTRIINTNRNKVPVFVEFRKDSTGTLLSKQNNSFKEYNTTIPIASPLCESDTLTYRFAKEYLDRNKPRFFFIGFDETDHFAHGGKYDNYLAAVHTQDSYLKDLWNYIQNTEQYKDKTTLIVTCDHGRGDNTGSQWRHHGGPVSGAQHIWMAILGPDTPPNGELKKCTHYRQNQIAQTIAHLLGKKYVTDHYIGEAIDCVFTK
jgi:hypothetical protein